MAGLAGERVIAMTAGLAVVVGVTHTMAVAVRRVTQALLTQRTSPACIADTQAEVAVTVGVALLVALSRLAAVFTFPPMTADTALLFCTINGRPEPRQRVGAGVAETVVGTLVRADVLLAFLATKVHITDAGVVDALSVIATWVAAHRVRAVKSPKSRVAPAPRHAQPVNGADSVLLAIVGATWGAAVLALPALLAHAAIRVPVVEGVGEHVVVAEATAASLAALIRADRVLA